MDALRLFATPVFVYELASMEATNQQLAEALLRESSAQAGLRRSNVGGWHSLPDLAQRSEPCFTQLMQAIVAHVGHSVQALANEQASLGRRPAPAGDWLAKVRWSVLAWAMVVGEGHYTELHDHGDAHWSVAYYVDAGDPPTESHPNSGLLGLVDPRRCGRPIPGLEQPSTVLIKPRSSVMVVFPGWLQHFVHSYAGTTPRICISANVTMSEPT
jgi:uncharacterized protein (TIGR02466 family)